MPPSRKPGAGRVIRRKRTTMEYVCSTCRTSYRKQQDAQECAKLPVEPILFAKGDKVTWKEKAECSHQRRAFAINATVTEVLPPEPPDEEYSNKWLDGALEGMHRRQYQVAFQCPCGRPRTTLLYAVEMVRL